MANLFPLDTQIPIVEVKNQKTDGKVTFEFLQRWNDLTKRLESAPYRIGDPVSLSDQHASILATPLAAVSLAAGLYRVSWYTRVTTADGVSSSIAVTLGWTEGGVALTVSGAAVAGDTVASVQSGAAPLIYLDAGGPITYATTYASNTPNKMRYELVLVLEKVG